MLIIRRYKETYSLPFSENIPCYLSAYLPQIKKPSRVIKYIKRYLFLFLKKEIRNEKEKISGYDKKILWINKSATSLGDSLMDLSSRTLLKSKNVDLLTDKKNAHIYANDSVFKNIFYDTQTIKERAYDLIILDSFSTRTVSIKNKLFPKTNFVSMFGFFNGPEVNRVLFSFHRLNYLLGLEMSSSEIGQIAHPSMDISKVKFIKLPNEFITIAVGGEWEYRTYNNWLEVVSIILEKYKNIKILLVGSENGKDCAKLIMSKFPNGQVVDCVGKYSYKETSSIISKSRIFIGCDGGLMHAANCFNRILVPLFARLEPKMQLTESMLAFSEFDKNDVNNISVDAVMRNFDRAFKVSQKFHQN